MKIVLPIMSAGATLAGLLMFGGIVFYTIHNDSGHTGCNPYLALVCFIPVAIMGSLHVFFGRKLGVPIWLGVAAIVMGIAGTGLLVYLDRSNTLLQYEVWLRRGLQ